MEKRGQFYLLAGIVIITLVFGFAAFSNYFKKNNSGTNFEYLGSELKTESGNVIDYAIKNNQNVKTVLNQFAEDYSNYSEADDLYFVFGTRSEITLAGYKKKSSGSISIDTGNGSQEFTIGKGQYKSTDIPSPSEDIKLTVNNVDYSFHLEVGENFYFVMSKEVNGERYIITG